MKARFQTAIGAYVVFAVLACATLQGKIRLATLIFLGGLALRTLVFYLAHRD
jgi:hypothetical protein